MTDQEIDKLLSTPIPGGSQARDWFLPHDTPRGIANIRDVVRRIVATHQERCAVAAWSAGMDYHTKVLGIPCDAREVGSAAAKAIRSL